MTRVSIEPDTKDWTWVLQEPCPECGYDATDVDRRDVASMIVANAEGWVLALAEPGVLDRPRPDVWSPLEYACHVRDVNLLFDERLRLMLREVDPLFSNWDQDTAAVEQRYDLQDPAEVAADLLAAARQVAATYASVEGDQWARAGLRSNGAGFTVDTLARYHLHDLVHHLCDVGFDPVARTTAAYDAAAATYAEGTAEPSDAALAFLDRLVEALPPGARVLEIGSGGGRDAELLEERGLSVRRTDIAPGFVELLRARGFDADILDPLDGDLADPESPERLYDAVLASASLLHVGRADLRTVLARLAAATRVDGLLHLAVREGDGELWSTHGHVAQPRHFTLWREPDLVAVVEASGWAVTQVTAHQDTFGWLELLCRRVDGPS